MIGSSSSLSKNLDSGDVSNDWNVYLRLHEVVSHSVPRIPSKLPVKSLISHFLASASFSQTGNVQHGDVDFIFWVCLLTEIFWWWLISYSKHISCTINGMQSWSHFSLQVIAITNECLNAILAGYYISSASSHALQANKIFVKLVGVKLFIKMLLILTSDMDFSIWGGDVYRK